MDIPRNIVLKIPDPSDAQKNTLQRNAINQEMFLLNVYTADENYPENYRGCMKAREMQNQRETNS